MSDELTRRYKRRIASIRDRAALSMVSAWARLDRIDEADIETYTRVTAAPLAGAKQAAVTLAAAFYTMTLGIRPTGVRARDVNLEPDVRGPFRAAWHALAEGRAYDEALTVGTSTAQAAGFDFVQSSARRTGDLVVAESGVPVKWRRVPGDQSCDWCRLVAGQLYSTSEAADFGHERDDCDVVPVLV